MSCFRLVLTRSTPVRALAAAAAASASSARSPSSAASCVSARLQQGMFEGQQRPSRQTASDASTRYDLATIDVLNIPRRCLFTRSARCVPACALLRSCSSLDLSCCDSSLSGPLSLASTHPRPCRSLQLTLVAPCLTQHALCTRRRLHRNPRGHRVGTDGHRLRTLPLHDLRRRHSNCGCARPSPRGLVGFCRAPQTPDLDIRPRCRREPVLCRHRARHWPWRRRTGRRARPDHWNMLARSRDRQLLLRYRGRRLLAEQSVRQRLLLIERRQDARNLVRTMATLTEPSPQLTRVYSRLPSSLHSASLRRPLGSSLHSQGGFGQTCNGVDSNCSGYLYCTGADLLPTVSGTCGGLGAFCQDYTVGDSTMSDAYNEALFNQFCQSGASLLAPCFSKRRSVTSCAYTGYCAFVSACSDPPIPWRLSLTFTRTEHRQLRRARRSGRGLLVRPRVCMRSAPHVRDRHDHWRPVVPDRHRLGPCSRPRAPLGRSRSPQRLPVIALGLLDPGRQGLRVHRHFGTSRLPVLEATVSHVPFAAVAVEH